MTISPTWTLGALALTTSPYLVVQDTPDYGTPDVQTAVLTSLLGDGDIELTSRRGNRTLTLQVLIEGSLTATATAEAALIVEMEKPFNRLTCNPGDGAAPSFSFTVFQGAVTYVRDEAREAQGLRLYTLTWRSLPWTESATEVVVPALAASGTTTTSVDTMAANTGWASTWNGNATTTNVVGSTLNVASPATAAVVTLVMTRTGSITTSSTRYLVLDWKLGPGTVLYPGTSISAISVSGTVSKVAEAASPTLGYTRTWWYVPVATSLASVQFSVATNDVSSTVRQLVLDNLDRSDVRPASGSAKQQQRSLDISGSAPSSGSISVQHATSALGDVLLYTCPDDGSGYSPPLRNYMSFGASVATDATAASGFTNHAGPTIVTLYDIPAKNLPEGEYLIVCRCRSTTATLSSATFFAQALNNNVAAGTQYVTPPQVIPNTAAPTFIRFGMMHLPTMLQSSNDASIVRVGINNNTASSDLLVDEVYLFNMTTGRLSQVACGTAAPTFGGTSNRLWLDAPTVENQGLGALWRGTAADRSDAEGAYQDALSPTVHKFAPGTLKVFSVAMNPTTAVDVAYRYRPAWQMNAAI